jgi:hypothetical protein
MVIVQVIYMSPEYTCRFRKKVPLKQIVTVSARPAGRFSFSGAQVIR